MSYSISKINYYINKVSFGNNQTIRNNTDFGIYTPSTEDTSSLPLSEILVGPQVVFAEPSVTVTVGPATSNQSGAPTGSPLNGPSSILEQQNVVGNILPEETVESNVANIFSSVRTNRAREAVRNAQQAAERASTNNFGRGNRR